MLGPTPEEGRLAGKRGQGKGLARRGPMGWGDRQQGAMYSAPQGMAGLGRLLGLGS